MKFERNAVVACSGLLILVCSCSTLESLKPDSISSGLVVRQVGGKLKPYEKRTNINLMRAQANYKLTDKVSVWDRFDFTYGDVKFSQHLTELDVRGHFESFGVGVSYFPFEKKKNLSFDFGGELFYADIPSITGKIGLFKNEISDNVFGYGLNAGVSLKKEIRKNISFVFSGGYNFTGNSSSRVDYDFDGFYGFVGLRIDIK